MQISGAQRWHSSERIAAKVLEEMGFHIVETNKKILINNVEVGEIDIIARDSEGNLWAVEVKAGKLDVTGVRQAYVNAVVAGMKPMVVCKGFADDAAKELADKLGVKVVQLSDIFLVEDEELEIVVREAVEDALMSYFELLFIQTPSLRQDQIQLLEAIASSQNLSEAAEKLGVELDVVIKKLDELKSQGIVPRWARKYTALKRVAQMIIYRQNLVSMLNETKNLVDSMKSLIVNLQQLVGTARSAINTIERFVRVAKEASQYVEHIAEVIKKVQQVEQKMEAEVQQGNVHHEAQLVVNSSSRDTDPHT